MRLGCWAWNLFTYSIAAVVIEGFAWKWCKRCIRLKNNLMLLMRKIPGQSYLKKGCSVAEIIVRYLNGGTNCFVITKRDFGSSKLCKHRRNSLKIGVQSISAYVLVFTETGLCRSSFHFAVAYLIQFNHLFTFTHSFLEAGGSL